MDGSSFQLESLACELADALAVIAPRGWVHVELSLARVGDQVRVAGVDAKLRRAPPPKPELGMDAGSRMAGMSAALTEAMHLLHERGVEWGGERATLAKEGTERLVLTLHNRQGPPAASVSVPRPMLDALFLAEPFLDALVAAEPFVQQAQKATFARLEGCTGWSLDQPGRKAVFDLPGRPKLEVEAELLGTWTSADESWLWGWANSTVDPACTRMLELSLAPHSRPPGMAALWRERFGCEEPFAFRLAQLATHRVGATGTYRGGFSGGWCYLALMG